MSANDAVADSEPFTLSSAAMTQAAMSARESATDSARISRDRAGVNTQRAAANAKAQAEAKAKADADAKAAKVKEEALAKARAAAAQEKARASAIANAQSDPRSAARALMADHGWGDSQWRCLNLLWEGESSWDYTAENSSSGAYGIPQSLPASKMAKFGADYRTNPITQITWGLWYIEQSYGTPCAAWDFWNARYPHWY